MALNDELFKRAREVIPGGVNSPVRAYKAVGGTPRFVASARGANILDSDGEQFIDYVMSYGAIILGHSDERIAEAVRTALPRGSSYGAPTQMEVELAETVVDLVPSVQMLRLVSSGTEAAMTAVRLARGVTGRNLIVKFEGCYHGHSDVLLEQSGSGMATFEASAQGSAGTVVLSFNDPEAVTELFDTCSDQIAAVIVEPVAANMGVVPAKHGYLEHLRAACDNSGALLIFDEVITGFRLGLGGAQEVFGVTPDLTCLGKVLGGGLPIGAVGGSRKVMEHLAPEGQVYQAGTLSGNPLAVAAGLAVLGCLKESPPFEDLDRQAIRLADALEASARDAGVPLSVNRVGSLLSPFFTSGSVSNFGDASNQDADQHARFFHSLLALGVHVAPSRFEAWFLSVSHTDEVIDQTIDAIGSAFGV